MVTLIYFQDSKRAFLHNTVTEDADKEKLDSFMNFCEDTVFEVKLGVYPIYIVPQRRDWKMLLHLRQKLYGFRMCYFVMHILCALSNIVLVLCTSFLSHPLYIYNVLKYIKNICSQHINLELALFIIFYPIILTIPCKVLKTIPFCTIKHDL